MLWTTLAQEGLRLRAPQLIAGSSDTARPTALPILQCFLEKGVKIFELGHCATASTLQARTRGSRFKSQSFRPVICPLALLRLWQDATFDSSSGRGSSSQTSRGFVCSLRMEGWGCGHPLTERHSSSYAMDIVSYGGGFVHVWAANPSSRFSDRRSTRRATRLFSKQREAWQSIDFDFSRERHNSPLKGYHLNVNKKPYGKIIIIKLNFLLNSVNNHLIR